MLQATGELDRQIDALANLPSLARIGIALFPQAIEGVQQAIEIFDKEVMPEGRVSTSVCQFLVCDQRAHFMLSQADGQMVAGGGFRSVTGVSTT